VRLNTVSSSPCAHAARSAGQHYLSAWAQGDDETVFNLTSPLAPFRAGSAKAVRRAAARRLDEGVCPVSSPMEVELQPLENLTAWEMEGLAVLAQSLSEISGARAVQTMKDDRTSGFPSKYLDRGDLTAFRYTSDGREFILIAVKDNGKWQVLEPAMPM